MEKKLSALMHAPCEYIITSLEGVLPTPEVGKSAPSGIGYSDLRPSKRGAVKINMSAVAIDLLLQKKVAALYSEASDVLYTEFDYEGKQLKAFVSPNAANVTWIGDDPGKDYMAATVPVYLYTLCTAQYGFGHIRNSFLAMKTMKTEEASVRAAHIIKICDDFYYETKNLFGLDFTVTVQTDPAIADVVKQMIRTENLKPADIIQECFECPDIQIAHVTTEIETEDNDAKEPSIFASAKSGGYFLDYLWDLDRQIYIPEVSELDEFVPGDEFFTMLELISHELNIVLDRMNDPAIGYGVKAIKNNYVNAILVGKPGTGKTTLAKALGASLGMPVRSIVNSKNTEEDTFQGFNKLQGGELTFAETPFLDVYKNGGILILEEFNLTDPGVMMGALGQALEKPFILMEDGYKEVRRHPLCVVIATMNTGTQGSREPSEALTSRLPNVFLMDDPSEEQFKEILLKQSGQKKSVVNKVYKMYTQIIAYLTSPKVNAEDVALSITLRHCLAALKLISIGQAVKQAIKNTMVGTIAIKDLDLAREVEKDLIEVMPD